MKATEQAPSRYNVSMMAPLIDVLLPTYEPDPSLLRETLDALCCQTERRWRCLIYDDASRIDVRAIISPYLVDARFRFLRSARRRGIGGNWNACLLHAQAPYVQFLFQDDLWSPTYLERTSQILLAEPDIGFVAANHTYLCDKGLEMAQGYDRLQQMKASLHAGRTHGPTFLTQWFQKGCDPNVIGEPSFVLLRRSLTESVGPFSTQLHQLLDVQYWVRLLLKTDWFFIADDLGIFRVHRKGASYLHHQAGDHFEESMRFFASLHSVFPPHSEEWRLIDQHIHQRFVDVISHVINRWLRLRKIGKGAVPILHYLLVYPRTLSHGCCRYLRQAILRWYRKAVQCICPVSVRAIE